MESNFTGFVKFGDIKVISFDVWLTLIKSNPQFKPKRAELIAEHLGYEGDPGDVARIIRTVDAESDHKSEETGVQYGFTDRLTAVWKMLPSHLAPLTVEGLTTLDNLIAGLMSDFPPILLEEDLLDTFDELRHRGYKLALVSNTGFIDGRHMRIVLERNGILPFIGFAVFSNECGLAKPNPQIYDRLVEVVGVTPRKIVHVGDNIKADYHGARSAGIQALHLSTDTAVESIKIPSIRALLDLLPKK